MTIILLLLVIILLSSVYYPIFAVEYFSTFDAHNIENVKQVKSCLCCKSHEKDNKKDEFKSFMKTLDKKSIYKNKEKPKVNEYQTLEDENYSPSCCPSQVSTSTGCLCDSSKLMSLIKTRGNNKEMCI